MNNSYFFKIMKFKNNYKEMKVDKIYNNNNLKTKTIFFR